MEIQYLKSAEIDKVKWNSCVHYANNGHVFGYKWYLDFVAKEWDALVEGDYESVFPLTWQENRRGRRQLVQPQWIRALGIYSIRVLSSARIRTFLEAIPPEFQQVDIHLNERNSPPTDLDFSVQDRTNYQLLLKAPYEELRRRYHPSVLEALDRAEARGLRIAVGLKPEQLTDFYIQTKGKRSTKDTFALLRIMYNALHRSAGFLSGVEDANGNLLAANFLISSHGKLLSLAPLSTPKGREWGAPEMLFDALIRTNATRPMILDWNQSDDEGLAERFGAEPNFYYRLLRDTRRVKWWW